MFVFLFLFIVLSWLEFIAQCIGSERDIPAICLYWDLSVYLHTQTHTVEAQRESKKKHKPMYNNTSSIVDWLRTINILF